ncbi:MAG: twin-arginine translocase subunit TatC [Candidatus Coatesbacteria bacterium]|nr:twin-arginine translocase subunit TatC [Candidatus Coatesbacteria bacterium]
MNDLADGKMSIIDHLAELRRRLIICIAALVVAFVVAYTFSQQILRVLVAPIQKAMTSGGSLAILRVEEAFVTNIEVALVAAVVAAFPVFIYQVWAFVLPALKRKEAKVGLTLVFSSTSLFVAGILFTFFLILPYAFTFFLASAQGIASPNISLAFYVSFCAKMMLAFGLVFQLPLVLVFLVRSGLVSLRQVTSARRYAIVLIFIVAAILTPPDILSQLLMAIPLLALFEIGVLAARLLQKHRQ